MTQKKKQLMSETVYEALRSIIVGRRFEPGQRLNVEELAREMRVSRTPVWEAIRRLGQEGVLQNIRNRGVFMAERPLERVRDIIEVRSALDRLASSLAVERIKRPMLDRISRCLPDQLAALEAGDVGSYYAADIRFHRLIAEAAGNAYLKGLYESITTHVFPTPFDIAVVLPGIYLVHEEIVAALRDHDHERVDRAVAHHGELLMARLMEQMASEAERKAQVARIKEGLPKNRTRMRRTNR